MNQHFFSFFNPVKTTQQWQYEKLITIVAVQNVTKQYSASFFCVIILAVMSIALYLTDKGQPYKINKNVYIEPHLLKNNM